MDKCEILNIVRRVLSGLVSTYAANRILDAVEREFDDGKDDTPYVGCEMGKKFDDDCIKCTKAWLESEVQDSDR